MPDSAEPATLVEARAALKSQQLERAVAVATQQAVQMEAERAVAIATAAEAMRQRKEAESQLAAQQAQLQQLQHQQHFQRGVSQPGGAQQGNVPGGAGPMGQQSFGGQPPQPPLPPQPYGNGEQWQGHPPPPSFGGPQGYGHQAQQQAQQAQLQQHHHHHQRHGPPQPPYGGQGGNQGGGGPMHPQMHAPQPIVCEFCGRWLSEMALDQGNHMCDEFWSYNAEFQQCGAQCALLIGGVQHLKAEHLQSFAMRFPNMRRVKHGAAPGEFNGLFMLTDEQRQTQALRLLANCNVRTIPLGHAASWRCLHVQLAPASCPQRVGQAEQSLQNQLLRVMQQRQTPSTGPSSEAMDGPAPGRADAWAVRASEAKRRNEPMPPQPNYFAGGGNGPGSTTGDWKCNNCGNINFAFREKCNRCNTPRPGAKLFGPMAQNERRICPFTVMLMRVPSHATELQVADALLTFGELAPGGIKFHRQGAKFKQRRVRMPPDGLALHAFCRFLRPASASASLQRGEVLILGQPVQINPAFMRGAMSTELDGMGVPPMMGGYPGAMGSAGALGAPPGFPGMGGAPGGGMGGGPTSAMGMGGPAMAGGMAGNMSRPGMPPLPPYPQPGGQPPIPSGPPNPAMPPLPASGPFDQSPPNQAGSPTPHGMPSGQGALGTGPWDGGGGSGSFGDERQMAQLELQMSSLNSTASPTAPAEAVPVPSIDVASFLAVAVPLLWQIDSFKAQLLHISPASDSIVVGMQSLLTALTESRAALGAPNVTRAALPSFFGETSRSKVAHAMDTCEAFEGMLSMFTESSDQRFVSCVERHCSMSLMEMCECSCDEMLEPMPMKQTVAYVSVSQMLGVASTDGSVLASQLATSVGPQCPTANCGNRMRILRYLMDPVPCLLAIGLAWDQATAVQPNNIHGILSAVDPVINLQEAFKSVPQPATASLRGLLCSLAGAFHSFSHDSSSSTWHWYGDGTSSAVGEEWDQVVSKCSQMRYKPCLLLYQVKAQTPSPLTVAPLHT
jgi:uncharacterized OB-fold protein